jgi:ADP-ribose pyrophosphatase YjhB (NUDIX family)
MRERPTVRILLLNPDRQLLLIRYEDLRVLPEFRHFWATVGGAIENGESIEEAAGREIAEETGLRDVTLGPAVWHGEPVIYIHGEPLQFRETYIVAHTQGSQLHAQNWTELERSTIREMRWWTAADIAASDAHIFPTVLADWLPPILDGHYPRALREIPGRRPLRPRKR